MKKTPEEIEKLADKYFELSHSRLRSVNQKEYERELFIAGYTQCQQDNAERNKHLQWIFDRMIEVHKENPNYDYMIKFKSILTLNKQ